MRSIKIKFGGSNTSIDFLSEVSGKEAIKQKYLVNTLTTKDSDPIFKNRGTDLLATAIGGALITSNNITDGFAAVDTLYFCNFEESKEVYSSGDNVVVYSLVPDYNYLTITSAVFNAEFEFADGSSSVVTFNVDTA